MAQVMDTTLNLRLPSLRGLIWCGTLTFLAPDITAFGTESLTKALESATEDRKFTDCVNLGIRP